MTGALAPAEPTVDVFGITHGVTVDQALGLLVSLLHTTVEAEQTVERLLDVVARKELS